VGGFWRLIGLAGGLRGGAGRHSGLAGNWSTIARRRCAAGSASCDIGAGDGLPGETT